MPRNILPLYKSFFVTAGKVTGIIHAAFLENTIYQNGLELCTQCILPRRNAEHPYVQIRTENTAFYIHVHLTSAFI
jgi:hypothetical protein